MSNQEHNQLQQHEADVVVIGGGQAGLSVGYYLRRTSLSYVILDAGELPGGAWQRAWNSLRLFSPAAASSLPGWMFPIAPDKYPTRDETIEYLAEYERRYKLPVIRPARVISVQGANDGLNVTSTAGTLTARAVVSATGSWQKPFIPVFPGQQEFAGVSIHSAEYKSPARFAGQQVLVVGAGNSGAQILAELSLVADTTWVTLEPPQFLPDDVDGRTLFNRASTQFRALQESLPSASSKSNGLLGKIVMVDLVRAARTRGILHSVRPFARFTRTGVLWIDGKETAVDAVVWCTGFRPALDHLGSIVTGKENGRVEVNGTRSVEEPRLWLVGYGEWTGFASATIVGVGRSARDAVAEIAASLS